MAGARPTSGIPRPPRPPGFNPGGRPVIDLSGQRFGRLLVIERALRPGMSIPDQGGAWWQTSCNCGVEKIFPSARLRAGKLLNCGSVWHKNDRTRR